MILLWLPAPQKMEIHNSAFLPVHMGQFSAALDSREQQRQPQGKGAFRT